MVTKNVVYNRKLEAVWIHFIMMWSCFGTKPSSKSNNINSQLISDIEPENSLEDCMFVQNDFFALFDGEKIYKYPYIKRDREGNWAVASCGYRTENYNEKTKLLLCHIREKTIVEIPSLPAIDNEGYLIIDSSIIIPRNHPDSWDIYGEKLNVYGTSLKKDFYIKKAKYISTDELSYSLHIVDDEGSEGINLSYYFKRDFNSNIRYVYQNIYLASKDSKQIVLFLVTLNNKTESEMFSIALEDIQNVKKNDRVLTYAHSFCFITDLMSSKDYQMVPDSLVVTGLNDETNQWNYILFDYQLIDNEKQPNGIIQGRFLINKEEKTTFKLKNGPYLNSKNQLVINRSDLVPFFFHKWGVLFKKAFL